jgi:hypothetical protein
MRYSVFDQGRGDFAYYEAEDGIDINDDRPVPRFDPAIRTPIGIPSVLAGRPMPSGAKYVGRGVEAVGMVSTGKPQKAGSVLSKAVASLDPSLGAFDIEDTNKYVKPAIPFMAATAGAMVAYRLTERQSAFITFAAVIAGAYAGFYGSRRLA